MISVERGDITHIQADALVNPSNSYGLMGGGVALVIKQVGGQEIEDEAVKKVPIHVGFAVETTGGQLPVKYVIHSSTMEEPAQRISTENVEKAMFAALELAKKLGIKKLTVPGLGTGVGRVNPEDAAKTMVQEARKFPDLDVVLVAHGDDLEKAFKEAI
ncbi:MAG: macro domain-containing protein [Candidatus Aenigmatarchaeota archaeon]